MEFEPITPAFASTPYVIGMSSSNQYAPYLAVYLQSIIDHAKEENRYDIVIFETDMTAALPEDVKTHLMAQIPAARLGKTDDIAAAVLYLASEPAGYVTGTVLHVNGGMFMG